MKQHKTNGDIVALFCEYNSYYLLRCKTKCTTANVTVVAINDIQNNTFRKHDLTDSEAGVIYSTVNNDRLKKTKETFYMEDLSPRFSRFRNEQENMDNQCIVNK